MLRFFNTLALVHLLRRKQKHQYGHHCQPKDQQQHQYLAVRLYEVKKTVASHGGWFVSC